MTTSPAKQGSGTGNPPADPRVPLAAERTFLAWIRTGLALIGAATVFYLLVLA